MEYKGRGNAISKITAQRVLDTRAREQRAFDKWRSVSTLNSEKIESFAVAIHPHASTDSQTNVITNRRRSTRDTTMFNVSATSSRRLAFFNISEEKQTLTEASNFPKFRSV